jgi:hypothetical protein
VKSSLYRYLCAACIYDQINSARPGILDPELLPHVSCIPSAVFKLALALLNAGRKMYISCPICFGEIQTGSVDIDGNDTGGTRRFSYCHTEQSYRPTSENGNGLTGAEVAYPTDCMDADRKRLHLQSEHKKSDLGKMM